VQVTPMKIEGAHVFEPQVFGDARGAFSEWFKAEVFEAATGHPLTIAQSNMSTSRAGALRGIHFADVPPGQAKYVSCPVGAVVDVVVDTRLRSPTFGQWDSVRLDGGTGRSVYLSEGLGHAFVALTDDTVVTYLCSTPYNPQREHGIDPTDPALGIDWTRWLPEGTELLLSDKDRAAPTLADASDLLPSYDECRRYVESLRSL
jgi:dTDP-4-dehydrorhamnose 3,5-epimerase